jgi:predicted amidophosphoribosyltransferase
VNCPACSAENRDTARFCGDCAAPLVREATCPNCGSTNPPGRKFCDECGAEIKVLEVKVLGVREYPGPLTANSLTTNTLSRRSYTPKHLADKILQSKSALEGERKQVTVLFADVKGSMDLAE